jgi:hypothetical protein
MSSAPPPIGGPSWGAVAPGHARTAAGLAARLGAYCWVEQSLFSLLGGWLTEIGEPDVKAFVAETAEHAAWRAQRWFEVLPAAAPGADELVAVPPSVAHVVVVASRHAQGADRTLEKLAVLHRALIPRLSAAYTAHLEWAEPVSEASVRRLLTVTIDDLGTDQRHGERVLQAVWADVADGARVHGAAGPVEDAIAAAGGIVGPGSVGNRPSVAP